MTVRFLSLMLSLFWGVSMFSYLLKVDSLSFSDKYLLAFFICA